MELKDLPKPISREDIYKYAICNGLIDNLPKPLSRQDFYLMALINGDTEDLPKPISRLDIIMYNCVMGTMDNLPKLISRADYYWTAICTGLKNNIPEPISRSDYYDYYLALYSAFREWLEYRGETIQAECSRQAYIKDLKLEGRTLKNLVKDSNVEKSIGVSAMTSAKYQYNTQLKQNTIYTCILDLDIVNWSDKNRIDISLNGGNITSKLISSSDGNKIIFTYDTDSKTNLISLWVYFVANSTNGVGTVKSVTVLEGDYSNIDINYIDGIESCGSKEGKINLNVNSNIVEIPSELRGLPNGIKDSIEKVDGVWNHVKRISTIIINSDTNIASWNGGNKSDSKYVFGTSIYGYMVAIVSYGYSETDKHANVLCDNMKTISYSDAYWGNDFGIALVSNAQTPIAKNIVITSSSITTVEDLKTWLSNNQLTVYYPLKEPVITPLSQELQEQLDRLQATKGSNIITTNSNVKANIECNLPV